MNVPDIKVEVVCLFCGSILSGPDNHNYSSGDLIKCVKCGEENDYESVLEVAKEKGIKKMKAIIEAELKKQFKNIFK